MSEDTVREVRVLIQQVAAMQVKLTEIETEVQRSIHISEENSRALRGYDGEPGLIVQVETLQQSVEDHHASEFKCPINDIAVALYGDPKNFDSRPGLIADMRDTKKWQASINKFYWIVVAALIAGALNFILGLVDAIRLGGLK